jgi:ADP-L-glycero-D-manno-heptose 6-epimerase
MLLLTGAAGFIGSNILRGLNARGYTDIICVDDLTDGTKCVNLSGTKFYDYYDCEELFFQRLSVKLQGIIHMGATSSTGAADGREIIANNFSYTKKIFRLAESNNCPVVYASSASVYGNGARGFREEEECEQPNSPYSCSKWMIDQYVHRHSIPAVGLRYFNVYGPGEEHKRENASFAHKLFKAALQQSAVEIFEHPTQTIKRDFIYVKDAVDITLFCLFSKFVPGVYNVGTGIPQSFDDMLDAGTAAFWASRVGGTVPSGVNRRPLPEEWLSRYQVYTCADITNLRKLGWTNPMTTLQDGMKQHWEAMTDGTRAT